MSEKPAYDIAKALAYLDPLQLGPPELAIERIDDPAVRVQPDVGRTAAALLDLLVRLQRPERILEIGTCLGYAACALGRAARDHGGRVLTYEIDPALAAAAQRNVASAGLAGVVEIRNEDARAAIERLDPAAPFGLILQDGGKDDYLPMLEPLLALLPPGGLLVSDDVLFPVMDLPERARPWARAIDAYNVRLRDLPGLRTVWLPIGDGIAISYKER